MGQTVGSLQSEPQDTQLRGQIVNYLNQDKLKRRGDTLKVSFMKDPQGYNAAKIQKAKTGKVMSEIK